jgi:hypothetical protein
MLFQISNNLKEFPDVFGGFTNNIGKLRKVAI